MIKKPKVLVTGARGMVGSYVSRLLTGIQYDLCLANKDMLDVTQKKHVCSFIASFKPDIVIHLAAKTNVDECERNPKETFMVNTEGTKNLVIACANIDPTFVFVSTAAIFNGSKKGFYENDNPKPLNIYGRSKCEAEFIIQKILEKFYIIRAGWMIGGGQSEKKFISYIIDQIKRGQKVNAVCDRFGTITYAKELVLFIEKLYQGQYPYGIYHFGSKGFCTRYDIAKEIARIIQSESEVTPVSSRVFSDRFFAPRPKYETLKSKKVSFSNFWKETLTDYITNEVI